MNIKERIIGVFLRFGIWLRNHPYYKELVPFVLLVGIIFSLVYATAFSAPYGFPSGSLLKIRAGTTIHEAGVLLKEKGLIRSVSVFEGLVRVSRGEIIAGEYSFERRQNIFLIAQRLAHGDYDIEPVRVTIPEGTNVFEMKKILSKTIADFDAEKFIQLAEKKEGFLYPDTYFFYPGEEPEAVISAMENNFALAIASISTTTLLSGRTMQEIVTMASLLEEEAPASEDRRIIAGILWRRIEIGMALQVDAVFPYIIGKNSFNLTKEDLKHDSPYNTYVNKGLPPGPITNPGLDALEAAVNPSKSTYLFYLSDLRGNFHYCSTYICHVENKRKYLD